MPKLFVPLVGQASTFQQVLARIADPELFARPIVISQADFRFGVAENAGTRRRGGHRAQPMRRVSGPAVTVAAVLAAERGDDQALSEIYSGASPGLRRVLDHIDRVDAQ
jgi:mannose-1-phosphate guanylyltransferase/mannose-6-phosphate isomerase